MSEFDPSKNADEMDIFLHALELPGEEEREAYVRQACQGREDLQRRVEELLHHHEDGDSVLSAPAFDLGGAVRKSSGETLAAEGPGSKIGSYTLLEKLGEGGGGIVYSASQEKPLRREVALKILKLGMDTREVIARFDIERQALARMDHDHIAKVLDAGATSTGRPYFVMERVSGERLTHYCDTHRLSTEARIRLFIKVCDAVQHAHQKGLIHRDLKPSNILVRHETDEEDATPKVIDFGIAKATAGQLGELTVVTQDGHFLGTPAYMSPEQAAGGDNSVDTQSDIFSLGVILYELMTGRTPCSAQELRSAGPIEMRKLIIEKRPERPSTLITRISPEERLALAERRQVGLAKYGHDLKGDLDRVAMKALEKDKEHRYQTAKGLRDDLVRYLKNEPVTAVPPSASYRVRKFVERNRVGVAAAVGVISLVTTLICVAVYLNLQETRRAVRAEEEATRNEGRALVALQKSEQTARIMMDMLDAAKVGAAAGRDPQLLWDILDSTAKRLDGHTNLFPEVEGELRMKIGRVMMGIGRNEGAESNFRRALEIYENLYGDTHHWVFRSMTELSSSIGNQGKHEEAAQWRLKTLERYRELHGGDHMDIVWALQFCSRSQTDLRRYAEAERFGREALEMSLRLLPGDSLILAETFSDVGRALRRQGKGEEAERMYRRAMKVCEQNDNSICMSIRLDDLASLALERGDLEEAERCYRKSLGLKSKYQSPTHADTSHSHHHLAMVLARLGNKEEAEMHLRKCIEVRELNYPEEHPLIRAAREDLASLEKDQRDP